MKLSGLLEDLWELQFWASGHAAAAMLWLGHGRCLQALGATRAEYFREVRYEISRFMRALERRRTTKPQGELRSRPLGSEVIA
jgi:hypothetical protein